MKVKMTLEFKTEGSLEATKAGLAKLMEGLNSLAIGDTSGNKAEILMIEDRPQVLFEGSFKSGIGFVPKQ